MGRKKANVSKKKKTKTTKKKINKKTKKASKKKKGKASSFFDECIPITEIDELYSYINKVQLQLEASPKLQLNKDNYLIALNILDDIGLSYKIYKTREFLIRINPDPDRDYNTMVDESVNEFIAEFFDSDDLGI